MRFSLRPALVTALALHFAGQASPCSGQASSLLKLQVIYPVDSTELRSGDRFFIYGNVTPASAQVYVDGKPVVRLADGVFVGERAAQPGTRLISVQAVHAGDTTVVTRSVRFPSYFFEEPGDSARFDLQYGFLASRLTLRADDERDLFVKATPGSRLSLYSTWENAPLAFRELVPNRVYRWESHRLGRDVPPFIPPIRGIYTARLRVPRNAPTGEMAVRLRLQTPTGDTRQVQQTIRILSADSMDTGTALTPVYFTKPGSLLTEIVFPPGSHFPISGEENAHARIALAPREHAWLPVSRFYRGPDAFTPSLTTLREIREIELDRGVQLQLHLDRRAAYEVRLDSNLHFVAVRLFRTQADSAHVRRIRADHFQSDVSLRQLSDGIFQITERLTWQVWGYRAWYEQNTLLVELYRPPSMQSGGTLVGLTICLDAGHAPDDGAVGAAGTREKDATLEYAAELERALTAAGARVFLTRPDTSGINLASRAVLADAIDADLFLSLHFNALPDGVSPLRPRGSSVYYFHPQSKPLAAAIQAALVRMTRQRNLGVFQGDLAVCRITAMPAVLLEPAFIAIPEEERKIRDPRFRARVCRAIVSGVQQYRQQAVD